MDQLSLAYTASSGEGVVAAFRGLVALARFARVLFEDPAVAVGILVFVAVITGVVYMVRKRRSSGRDSD